MPEEGQVSVGQPKNALKSKMQNDGAAVRPNKMPGTSAEVVHRQGELRRRRESAE